MFLCLLNVMVTFFSNQTFGMFFIFSWPLTIFLVYWKYCVLCCSIYYILHMRFPARNIFIANVNNISSLSATSRIDASRAIWSPQTREQGTPSFSLRFLNHNQIGSSLPIQNVLMMTLSQFKFIQIYFMVSLNVCWKYL